MGQVYYDMGFLSTPEVVECSATDLIGQYVGQTGPKTIAQLDKALGKILFIDEAYRLCEGNFATEAVNEVVDQLTKPRYLNKLIVILAGYDRDINKLISKNPGLSSRFPEEVIFQNMAPEKCVELLQKKLRKQDITIPHFEDHSSTIYNNMCALFRQLAALPSFGNGREIETLAKNMLGFVYKQDIGGDEPLILSEHDALQIMKTMLKERRARVANLPGSDIQTPYNAPAQTAEPTPPVAPTSLPLITKEERANDIVNAPTGLHTEVVALDEPRDPGVSDEIWTQLQADKLAAEQLQEREDSLLRQQSNALAEARAEEALQAARLQELRENQAKDQAEMLELKRRREEARLAEQKARMERERVAREMERARLERERRREEERKAQEKLREMGVCVAGYKWIKGAGGYRCAGGSHWVSDRELGI